MQFFTYGNYDFQRGTLRNLSLNYSLSYRDAMYYNVTQSLSFLLTRSLTSALPIAARRLRHRCTGTMSSMSSMQRTTPRVLNGTQLFPNEPTNALVTLSYKL